MGHGDLIEDECGGPEIRKRTRLSLGACSEHFWLELGDSELGRRLTERDEAHSGRHKIA
jgi:hypothetical protein